MEQSHRAPDTVFSAMHFSPLDITDHESSNSEGIPMPVPAHPGPPVTSAELSDTQALVCVIKCAVGAGTFTLPYAFLLGGLVFSILGTICIGCISGYSLHLLAACESRVHGSGRYGGKDRVSITYPLLGEIAFPNFNIALGGMSINVMSSSIFTAIVLTSVSVSAVYLDFISTVLSDVLTSRHAAMHTREQVLIVIFPVLLLLIYLRDYSLLSKLSAIGNVSVFAGCITVLVYGAMNEGINGNLDSLLAARPTNVPAFFGDTSFLFAIHVVMLPLLQKMRNRENIGSIILTSYSIITFVNIGFASTAFLLFANSFCSSEDHLGPCGNILGNVSNGAILVTIKLCICVDLLFTIPLVIAASTEVIENVASRTAYLPCNASPSCRKNLEVYFIRTVFALCVLCLAVLIPNSADMVATVGGLVCAFAGYTVPPILYIKMFWNSLSPLSVLLASSISLFGISLICIVLAGDCT